MGLPLFHNPDLKLPNNNQNYTITHLELYKHIILSQRRGIGSQIKLSNGLNTAGLFEIVTIKKADKTFDLKLLKTLKIPVNTPKKIIVQALLKNKANYLALDLMTQAGVNYIIPWQANKSIAKWQPNHLTKWQNQIITSSEQSRQLRFPTLLNPKNTEQLCKTLIKDFPSQNNLILILQPNSQSSLTSFKKLVNQKLKTAQKLNNIIFIVGPEGGIAETEIKQLSQIGGQTISLGQNIYRSFLAGSAALISLNSLLTN
ncbi:MAG: 16S rRNA (uracil(1498)-N(3))-methyltransferase [Bifidobacteriaceae bacterium]|jgi:16S rRNA (uracil1498-N3)-methyltransferase|nr:16S rRNA (uracil(1498)-N(3))-methyltransferase [Bifidobacteriaceae bacterium]